MLTKDYGDIFVPTGTSATCVTKEALLISARIAANMSRPNTMPVISSAWTIWRLPTLIRTWKIHLDVTFENKLYFCCTSYSLNYENSKRSLVGAKHLVLGTYFYTYIFANKNWHWSPISIKNSLIGLVALSTTKPHATLWAIRKILNWFFLLQSPKSNYISLHKQNKPTN